jgi:ApbE family
VDDGQTKPAPAWVVIGHARSGRRHARARLAWLEARWSRFRPDSEISALNHAKGQPVALPRKPSPWSRSRCSAGRRPGRFDPTVLDGLEAAGYDRTFEQLPAHRAGTDPAPGPAPGLGGIALDAETSTVTLPGILQVTVVAGEAWRTEVAAKAAFLAAGPPPGGRWTCGGRHHLPAAGSSAAPTPAQPAHPSRSATSSDRAGRSYPDQQDPTA